MFHFSNAVNCLNALSDVKLSKKEERMMTSIFDQFFNLNKEDRKIAKIEYKNKRESNKEPIKMKATVYGRVQGVGFRFTTTHLAKKIGVNGFVRNESDGTVYIEATGSKEQIEHFISELAKGPSPSALVDKVVVEYDDSLKEYQGFSERY